MTPKNIEWPGNRKKAPSVYWMKFSGTLVIMSQGRYSFNFNIGWNTESFLKVDGLKILTDGQCMVSKDAGTCKAKGCAWDMRRVRAKLKVRSTRKPQPPQSARLASTGLHRCSSIASRAPVKHKCISTQLQRH